MKNKRHFVPFLVSATVIGLVCFLETLPFLTSKRQRIVADEGTRDLNVSQHRWDLFQRLEWIFYDWRVRLAVGPSAVAKDNLGAVVIDDASAATILSSALGYRYGLLWPRHVYAQLVRELVAEGASVVAFDILFTELRPDHDSLTQSTNRLALTPDQLFAQEIRQAGNVILAATRDRFPADLFRTNAFALGEISSEPDSDGILRRAKAFRDTQVWHSAIRRLVKPLRLNLTAATITSHQIVIPRDDGEAPFDVPLNEDGSLNVEEITGERPSTRQPVVTNERVWHMGIVLAAQELKLDLPNAEIRTDRIILRGANGLERVIPVDAEGYFYIDWTFRYSDARLDKEPFQTVLERNLARKKGDAVLLTNRWQNKLVVVGSVATGSNLSDTGATPLENSSFLLSKYWNIANSVLTNRFIRRSSNQIELLLIVGMGALAAVLTWKLRVLHASFCVAMAALLYAVVAVVLFVQYRYWLPIVLPVLGALLINHVSLVTYRVVFEQRERWRVKSIFTRIVSPDVVNELLNAETISLGGARREVTTLFADVRDFTEFTEASQASAQEFVRARQLAESEVERYFDEQASETLATVNTYLSLVADTVKKHQGTLDKYIGDCVMAFWGAPAANNCHAVDCVRAAIEAHAAIDALNQERKAENSRRIETNKGRAVAGKAPLPLLPILTFGTGINTGKVTVGLMGSDAHILNYTVFGHEVNLASRLEAVSGHGRIVISESTYRSILKQDSDLARQCTERTPVTVKGIRQPVRVFEVQWRSDSPPR